MSDNIPRCPKCGYPDIYLGAVNIECGYDTSCPNWTTAQAEEVDRLNAERYPEPDYYDIEDSSETTTSHTGPFQFSLDYDDDADTPVLPIPDFGTD